MFRDVSIVQQIGVAALAVATAVWAVGLVRVMRRERPGADVWRAPQALSVLPGQQGPPRVETVELTADERAAFAGLVRQYGDRRS
ncbi:hypothetical protein GKQ77_05465 [Streptomyces sp. BG9H]|uniref:Uncharacterized protein n=1 Tax=Streptomyces anatolicus TaxID=2675858 RepID=A0ABS6YKC8_9ACTN|nr:hypothetical protein [Streptomyces anatolicus]MBW5421016.1 hypothetical protein [Streptomyces anatolicus]